MKYITLKTIYLSVYNDDDILHWFCLINIYFLFLACNAMKSSIRSLAGYKYVGSNSNYYQLLHYYIRYNSIKPRTDFNISYNKLYQPLLQHQFTIYDIPLYVWIASLYYVLNSKFQLKVQSLSKLTKDNNNARNVACNWMNSSIPLVLATQPLWKITINEGDKSYMQL